MKATARGLILLMLAAGFALAQGTPAANQPAHGKGPGNPGTPRRTSKFRHPKKAPVTPTPEPMIAAAPQVPPTPLRPSQMPAVPPRVSYQNGKLTVVAENSTLGDVLNAVHNATGTQIETTGGPAGERVAAKIGPGSIREVLLAVLQGSRYDYILLGSANDPDKIDRMILTPKSAGTAGASAPVGSPVGRAAARSGTTDEDPDAEGNEGFATPKPGQPQPGQPTVTGTQPAATPNAQSPTTPGQNVKTPEQLLEDLRRMEQERRLQAPGAQDPRQRGERPPD